jgi:hypothetical protein
MFIVYKFTYTQFGERQGRTNVRSSSFSIHGYIAIGLQRDASLYKVAPLFYLRMCKNGQANKHKK